MNIDLHIHTSNGSDGALSVDDVFSEAKARNIDFMSITDHDSMHCQERAIALAGELGIEYITGVELNVAFEYPAGSGRSFSLDFLGYHCDITNEPLKHKLALMREHRDNRARQILERLNLVFDREGIERLTGDDIDRIDGSVEGALGRPHIASYLVQKGIVGNYQEAFDKYLVRLDVPKYPLLLAEASQLVRDAGGVLVLAHPDDPNGTSLSGVTMNLDEQAEIIAEYMLQYVDGVECWHSRHTDVATEYYVDFARERGLLVTGGSDCHQNPIIMGTVDMPDYVADQFSKNI